MNVSEVMAALDAIAPPHLALDGDPRGLLIGDTSTPVDSVLVALDVTPEVARQASDSGAQMIIAHHPLIYHPLRRLVADEPHPGGVALHCARHGIAVACAHTNWDIAEGGVNDVLARLAGIEGAAKPLRVTYREPLVKVAVFVPVKDQDRVLDAMAAAGAGAIGDYDRCAFGTEGTGTFRPLPGANPHIGAIGVPETVAEVRLEMIVPGAKTASVIAAMKAAHPYEEVAYDVYPLTNTASEYGLGRIGNLPAAVTPEAFLQSLRAALKFDEIRLFGPRDRRIKTIAVGGGACAELMPDAIAQGADVLVTSDVRHHEFVDAAARGFLLIDAGHAATEIPGTSELARRLGEALGSNARVAFCD
ncbi:MAG: Nif3-like dinuclear metal center hexameric protein [Armatimonadota bacterium]